MDKKKMLFIAIAVIMIVAIAAFAFISMTSTVTKVEITCNETVQNGDYISVVLNSVLSLLITCIRMMSCQPVSTKHSCSQRTAIR
jgi:hypothetical protein